MSVCLSIFGKEQKVRIYEAKIQYSLVRLGDSLILDTPDKVPQYMAGAFDEYPTQETFWVVLLDTKNRPIARTMVSLGTANATLVHPREVFRVAVVCSATAIIAVHNHPSGDPSPSSADIKVTRILKQAADVMQIGLLDHVIVGEAVYDPNGRGYYSFQESGMI